MPTLNSVDVDNPTGAEWAKHQWKWFLSDAQAQAFVRGYGPVLAASVASIRKYFPQAQVITYGNSMPASAPLMQALANVRGADGKVTDYTKLIDGYGSHLYPTSTTTLNMVHDATNSLRYEAAHYPQVSQKPIWITEWNPAGSSWWNGAPWYFQYDAQGRPGGELNKADAQGAYKGHGPGRRHPRLQPGCSREAPVIGNRAGEHQSRLLLFLRFRRAIAEMRSRQIQLGDEPSLGLLHRRHDRSVYRRSCARHRRGGRRQGALRHAYFAAVRDGDQHGFGRAGPSLGVMVGCYGVAMKPVACLPACLQALQSENPRQPALRCEISLRRDRQTHPPGRSVAPIRNKAVWARVRANSRVAASAIEANIAKVSGHGPVTFVRARSRLQRHLRSEERDEEPYSP
jgi:hypothetical protein